MPTEIPIVPLFRFLHHSTIKSVTQSRPYTAPPFQWCVDHFMFAVIQFNAIGCTIWNRPYEPLGVVQEWKDVSIVLVVGNSSSILLCDLGCALGEILFVANKVVLVRTITRWMHPQHPPCSICVLRLNNPMSWSNHNVLCCSCLVEESPSIESFSYHLSSFAPIMNPAHSHTDCIWSFVLSIANSV